MLRWAGHATRMGEMRNVYIILVGKHEGKRQLIRSRNRWNCNIRVDLKETGWESVDWISVAQDPDQ